MASTVPTSLQRGLVLLLGLALVLGAVVPLVAPSTVRAQEIVPIGQIQGAVADGDDGLAHRSDAAPGSPFACGSERFTVQAVVTQWIRTKSSSGSAGYGFFIQNAVDTADGDSDTSDGVFVTTGGSTIIPSDDPDDPIGSYSPQVGDEIVLEGGVQEFFNQTQLCSVRKVDLAATGRLGDTLVTEAAPPDDLADANRFWERHEGMRFHLDAGSKVVSGRDVFASTADAEVWVIRGHHPVAQRTDPYTNRVFRDPHPFDDVGPAGSFDNGNGYRIMLASHGLKWIQNDGDAMLEAARTFDTIDNEVTGSLYFSFGKYAIEAEQQIDLVQGADPSGNAPPAPPNRPLEYSTAVYNVENLYDFRDDPFDGCDFNDEDNPGCLFDPDANRGSGRFRVRPPYNYVPESQAAYEAQLADLAEQIVADLHAPDIVLIQEAEDQDICTVDALELVCDVSGDEGTNDADGKPDTLQELALLIAENHGVAYEAVYDRDGADDRGIVNAFLYRTHRVQLLEADVSHPVLGSDPQIVYDGAPLGYNTDVQNPKSLNAELPEGVELGDTCDILGVECVFTRDPLVGLFRVWRGDIGTSAFTDLYAVSNHFSSNPQARVEQRTEQAAYNAAIVTALEASEDAPRVLVGGDFNVFPRPDDPFVPPSDQLGALYDIGLQDLWAVVADEAPASAYSYVFQGQAQTLDNQFTTTALFDELNGVRFAHINADFAAEHPGDGSRGSSDHDPQAARFDALTIDSIMNLVEYLVEAGMVEPGVGESIISRLAAADDLAIQRARDRQLDQLDAFVERQTPRHVDPVASAVLLDELALLRGSAD